MIWWETRKWEECSLYYAPIWKKMEHTHIRQLTAQLKSLGQKETNSPWMSRRQEIINLITELHKVENMSVYCCVLECDRMEHYNSCLAILVELCIPISWPQEARVPGMLCFHCIIYSANVIILNSLSCQHMWDLIWQRIAAPQSLMVSWIYQNYPSL